QAHPCPFSYALGGKKRLEDVLDDIGGHPLPRITEGQTHVGTGWYGAVMGCTVVRHLDRLDTDLQDAPRLPHRILGIRTEVHNHLVQLVTMRQHHAVERRAVLTDLNRGGEGRAEQGEDLLDHLRDLHRLPVPRTRATERQDLLDQVFGTV